MNKPNIKDAMSKCKYSISIGRKLCCMYVPIEKILQKEWQHLSAMETTEHNDCSQATVVLLIFALSKFRGKPARDHSAVS